MAAAGPNTMSTPWAPSVTLDRTGGSIWPSAAIPVLLKVKAAEDALLQYTGKDCSLPTEVIKQKTSCMAKPVWLLSHYQTTAFCLSGGWGGAPWQGKGWQKIRGPLSTKSKLESKKQCQKKIGYQAHTKVTWLHSLILINTITARAVYERVKKP